MTPSKENTEPNELLRDSLQKRMAPDEPSRAPDAAPRPSVGMALPEEADAPERSSLLEKLQSDIYFTAPGMAQMTAFCRQLATLIGVGIPLLQALGILAERVKHPRLRRVVGDVAQRVEEGGSFSEALEAHPGIFSSLVVNVVRIGESGGILEGALGYLADIMERRYELRRRIAAALAYPIAVLTICALFILVTLGFAIPVFGEVYSEHNVELPPLTRFVLDLSNAVQSLWWLIVLAIAGAIYGARLLLRKSPGALKAWDRFCLRAPIVRSIAVKINVTRTALTLAKLLQAGIPLLEALMICAETAENTVVAEAILDTHDNLERGGQLEAPLRKSGVFPALVVDMIAIGDEAGRLELMFEKIAETYDSDVNQSITTLNAVLEPTMIAVMAGLVFVLALAVLQPYWQMANAIEEQS